VELESIIACGVFYLAQQLPAKWGICEEAAREEQRWDWRNSGEKKSKGNRIFFSAYIFTVYSVLGYRL